MTQQGFGLMESPAFGSSRRRRGTTLFELLITLSLVGVIAGSIVPIVAIHDGLPFVRGGAVVAGASARDARAASAAGMYSLMATWRCSEWSKAL